MKIDTLFAASKNIISEGIISRLKNEPILNVSGWVTDVVDLQQMYDDTKPDCLLIGVTLYGARIVPELRGFMHKNPDANLLLISLSSGKEYVKQILDTGVKGIYVSPFSEYDHLVFGIQCVANGRTYLCNRSTEVMIGDIFEQKIKTNESEELSAREKQITQLIAEGYSSKEIAAILLIAPGTVDVHRRNLMRKLGLHKAADITKYAIKSEMIFV